MAIARVHFYFLINISQILFRLFDTFLSKIRELSNSSKKKDYAKISVYNMNSIIEFYILHFNYKYELSLFCIEKFHFFSHSNTDYLLIFPFSVTNLRINVWCCTEQEKSSDMGYRWEIHFEYEYQRLWSQSSLCLISF